MDGTIYATLSRNMANGSGSFWSPHFSDTLFPVFVEHPPLALGLEAIFFTILGDHLVIEKIYSLLTIFITSGLIVSIWNTLQPGTKTGWLPLLFWIMMPTVNWIAVNNMLENTLVIFICLSVLFYLKSTLSRRALFLFLSGFMLSAGFLTKGFVTFTPLAFPFFSWISTRNRRFKQMITDTAVMFFSAVMPLLLLFLFKSPSEFLVQYISMASDKIATGVTTDSRFYIMYRLLMELLPGILMLIMIVFFSRQRKNHENNLLRGVRLYMLFFSIGISGVLPILLTMDQSTYFLYLSLPFFAISLGLMVNPIAEKLMLNIEYSSKGFTIFRWSGAVMLFAGIVLSVYFRAEINRDRNMIKDMKIILDEIEEGTIISIQPELTEEWRLYAYYARYKDISLDPDPGNTHNYLLINRFLYPDLTKPGFREANLETTEYVLLEREAPEIKVD